MKKNNFVILFLISLFSCSVLLSGCSDNGSPAPDSATESQTSAETELSSDEASELPVPDADTTAATNLLISFTNHCSIEIGMVAVIDPRTGEQLNVGSLSDGETLTVGADWPDDVTSFDWALYNTDGELCIEATTDIRSASHSVSLLLTGNGTVETIEEQFE